jgi:solute carrier family 25 (adenine nucleotide translocator) protein 4/5/6/31
MFDYPRMYARARAFPEETLMAPLDRVHRLLQTQGSNPAVISGETAEYKGVVDCFRRILAEQGMMAFWRGHIASSIPPILQMGVHQKCVALPINDFLKRNAPKYDPKTDYYKDFLVKLVSGGAAGGLANLAFYPIGMVRSLLVYDLVNGNRKFHGIVDCVMKTAQSDGISGFYRGCGPVVPGAFAYRFIMLTFHKELRKIPEMNPYKDSKGILGVFMGFFFGFLAKNITSPVMYPFDTIACRMRFDSLYDEHLYKSSIDCFMKVIRNEGIQGLYKGLGASFLNQVVGFCVHQLIEMVYNLVKKSSLWAMLTSGPSAPTT